jgi:hypothetical protein
MREAVEDGFGSGGVVLAGLTRPEADFEASGVRRKIGLVGQQVELVDGRHKN